MSKCSFSRQLLFLILFTILFSSCNKENDKIGSNLIPSGDKFLIKFDSTIQISASTQESRISTKNLSDNYLGIIDDLTFGTTNASILASITPATYYATDSAFKVFIGENHIVNSVSLDIIIFDTLFLDAKYDNIEVYKMILPIDTIHADDNLFSNTSSDSIQEYYGAILATTSVERFKNSETNFDTLRFTFATSVGDDLLNPPTDDSDTYSYKSAFDFINFFKGFYFKINETTEEFYTFFDLFDNGTFLKVNFTVNDSVPINKEMIYTFSTLDDYSATFNSFIHDFTGTYGDPFVQANHFPIYQFGGLEARLTFPELNQWIDSMPMAISKAQLTLPLDDEFFDSSSDDFSQILNIRVELSVDNLVDLLDESLYGNNFHVDGIFNKEKNVYVFNIKNHLQFILERRLQNAPLIIRTSFYDFGSGTVIENDSINGKIELDIWYTDLRGK